MQLTLRHFPARIAELGFTAQLPADWISHELPSEEVDFSDPTLCVPLAIVAAPHAAIVFASAARPAYDDGTLHDWASYLLDHNRLQPSAIGPGEIAGVPALVGEAAQDSELGPIVVRFAFLEDGGRLINLTLSAPELFADTVRAAWFAMLQSFTLETPKGSRFTPNQANVEPPAPTAIMTSAELAAIALSDDASSLDPEHPINLRLRDNGAGLVPRVASVDLEGKSARVAAGALVGIVRLPLGWHVIDDGRRTLVFDAPGRIQVSLNLREHLGATPSALARQLLQQYLDQQPDLPTVEHTISGIAGAGVRGIIVGNGDNRETLDQFFFVRDLGRDAHYLVARVSATADDLTRALDLAGDIVATFETPASTL